MPVIAVVEDNPDNRLLLHAILGDRFELTEYATGAEAIRGCAATPPALVLMDISLPDMDGQDVLVRLRREATLQGVPVVALTAHAMRGDAQRFLEAGFDGYVSKPIIDEAVLVDTIDRLLSPRPTPPTP